MERTRSRVVGLLDLPEGVLHLILSFLGTLSLAAARLTCQALREAARIGRKRVFICEGWCKAMACASPRVLQTMHTFQGLLDGLHHENLARCAHGSSAPNPSGEFERFLGKQLFTKLASEAESLEIENIYFGQHVKVYGCPEYLPPEPCAALARMQRLERLRLFGRFHSTILPQLPALSHLTCLEVDDVCSIEDIQMICSTLSLSRFGVSRKFTNEIPLDAQQMLAALATGNMAGLRELVLPLPAAEARHLSRLAPLTALTALELIMWGAFADLGGLAFLTGLKSLDMEIRPGSEESRAVVKSLFPLSALTGLTLLGIRTGGWNEICSLPCDVSMLSSLAALRVLRCSFFAAAEVFPGDPLPVQFRFLRSATALEELDLGFWGSFWSLPHASSLAMREAVCALTSLKKVTIKGMKQCYVPLVVFAAARSLESFEFTNYGPYQGPLSGPSSVQAFACFKPLAKLRSLILCDFDAGCSLRCADLVAGLLSTYLTCLVLNAKTERLSLELMQQIARFPDLQRLELSLSTVDCRCLAQLSELKCLTKLSVDVKPEHEAQEAAISAQAAQLKTVILERAHQVGAKEDVRIYFLCRERHG